MGWIYERDGHRLVEDDLTTGEWEHLYILVNRLGIPHREVDIDPLHCPVCRSAIAIQAALNAGIPNIETAAALLVDLPRGALPSAFTFTASSVEPVAERFEQGYERLDSQAGPAGPDLASDAVHDLDGAGVAAVI